jgi:hypothetical protein
MLKEELADIVYDSYSIHRTYPNSIQLMGGVKKSISEITDEAADIAQDILSKEGLREFNSLKSGERRALLHEAFETAYRDQKQAQDEDEDELETDFDTSDLNLLNDVYDKSRGFSVYNVETNQVEEYDAESVKEQIGEKQYRKIPKIPVKSIYNPMMSPNTLIPQEVDSKVKHVVNRYREPNWMRRIRQEYKLSSLSELRNCKPKILKSEGLPHSVGIFFDNLFPDKESRTWVYRYIFDALTSTNGSQYILYLTGINGNGKTIFAHSIMGNLFGWDLKNSQKLEEAFWKKEFNSAVVDKRFVYCDEVIIPFNYYEKMKDYANKMINVERKGVDANNNTELFYSMVCINNHSENYYIHFGDRRHCLPVLGDIPLKDVWTDSEMGEFVKSWEEDDELKYNFSCFILSRCWDERKDKPFTISQLKNKKFYDHTEMHLFEWQRVMLDMIITKGKQQEETIPFNKIKMKLEPNRNSKAKMPNKPKVESFLKEFRLQGKYRIGSIVEDRDEDGVKVYSIKIDPHFIIKPDDTEQDDGDDLL